MALNTDSKVGQELLGILRRQLIPWLQTPESISLVLAEFPVLPPKGIKVTPYPLEPLENLHFERNSFTATKWRSVRMVAGRLPYMGFILEGEADFRVAGTKARWDELDAAMRESLGSAGQVVSLPQRSLLFIPPGAPYDLAMPHWFRPHPERAFSRILWLQPYPFGASCHTCITRGTEHPDQPCPNLRDPEIPHLIDMLASELSGRTAGYERVAQGLLLAIVARVERCLSSGAYLMHDARLGGETPMEGAMDARANTNKVVLALVGKYIQANLDKKLSPAMIAANAFISTRHLNRIVRQELGLSVMQYVTQCRVETGKSLLLETELPVGDVGFMLGYHRPTHFGRVFRDLVGSTPAEFRRRKQTGKGLSISN